MTPRRQRALSLVVALVAAVVVFVLLRGRREEAMPPASTQEAASPETVPARPAPGAAAESDGPSAPQTVDVARLKEQYEAYKAGSVYPDWSYPMTPDQGFLIEWNKALTSDLPVDDDGKIFFRFDAGAARVFAGEAYTSWAEAWTVVNGRRKNLPFHFDKASVVLTSGPKMGDAFDLVFHDDGVAPDAQAGDFRFTNTYVPVEHPELAQASSARIEVYVDIGGMKRRFLRDFTWAPRVVLDVVGEHDAIEDGSLVATLDCDVHEDGLYTVYGNLFAADGVTPVATSKLNLPLEKGRQKVQLTFFGKVLFDQQVDGPYVLKDIHGMKRMGEGEYNNVWWNHAKVYRTHAFTASDFSSDEWNGEERRERLATFERVIAEMEQNAPQAQR